MIRKLATVAAAAALVLGASVGVAAAAPAHVKPADLTWGCAGSRYC